MSVCPVINMRHAMTTDAEEWCTNTHPSHQDSLPPLKETPVPSGHDAESWFWGADRNLGFLSSSLGTDSPSWPRFRSTLRTSRSLRFVRRGVRFYITYLTGYIYLWCFQQLFQWYVLSAKGVERRGCSRGLSRNHGHMTTKILFSQNRNSITGTFEIGCQMLATWSRRSVWQ